MRNVIVPAHPGRGARSPPRWACAARPRQTYHIAIAPYDDGDDGRFRLGAQAIDTPPNDDFADAPTLALGSSVTGTTRNATLECAVVFRATPGVTYRVQISDPGSGRRFTLTARPR